MGKSTWALVFILVLAPLLQSWPINTPFTPAEVQRSPAAPGHVLDAFNDLASTGESTIRSLDSRQENLVGCATYNGTVAGSEFGNGSHTSLGGDDVLLFGWEPSFGYWSFSIGGAEDDGCEQVGWIGVDSFVVAGYFRGTITLGSETLSSEGAADAFGALYNRTSGQWEETFSIGTTADDLFNAFTHKTDGAFAFVGSSRAGNFTASNPSISGAPDCTPTPPWGAVYCAFVVSTNSTLKPVKMFAFRALGNADGMDIIEQGSTGKLLMVGYFDGQLMHVENLSSAGSDDIFIARLNANLGVEYLTTFGGSGLDRAYDIDAISTGYLISGMVKASNATPAKVGYTCTTTCQSNPSLYWQATSGSGESDTLLMKTTPNGVVEDGFTFGSPKIDLAYASAVDSSGIIHLAGLIGDVMPNPASQGSVGVPNEYSAYYAKVNFTTGTSAHTTEFYATQGTQGSDARMRTVALMDDDDVWVGGGMSPGSQSNTFFGQHVSGYLEGGFLVRLGGDADGDGASNRLDNCPDDHNPTQTDYDMDSVGDACDADDDDDGIEDVEDVICPFSVSSSFVSSSLNDHDSDGCEDDTEDFDDDNDGFSDTVESVFECPRGHTNWTAGNSSVDRDADGCHDVLEDDDDDGDGLLDASDDRCSSSSSIVFSLQSWSDHDGDGCHDSEDDDIDDDGMLNPHDACNFSPAGWVSSLSDDHDADGCEDASEDLDDDNDGVLDVADQCTPPQVNSILGTALFPVWSDHDQDGCHDEEDTDIDNDGVLNDVDFCEYGEVQWQSTASNDLDSDGCRDSTEDLDDDNDGISDQVDRCDADSNVPQSALNWSSNQNTDHDGDGCKDAGEENGGVGEDTDDDDDGINDGMDACPASNLLLPSSDLDGDGCMDDEDLDKDGDGFNNQDDSCPLGQRLLSLDEDQDGCDREEDMDDDNDGVLDADDACDPNDPGPFLTQWSPEFLSANPWTPSEDIDSDGCGDLTLEDKDDDNDGVLDVDDACDPDSSSAPYSLGWLSSVQTDVDGDGCRDADEDEDDDGDGVSDKADFCDPDSADVFQLDWRSNPENDADADGCRDRDEDAQMLADKAAEERQQRMLMLGIGSVVLIIAVVAIIVSGRTKGQEINISGTTEGKIQIVGGVANNLFDHSKNEQTTSTVSSSQATVGQVGSQVEDLTGQEE